MLNFWQHVQTATQKLDFTRVIVVPHIAYYVMVATHMQYQYAAGVVAVIMVGELVYGHHSAKVGVHNEAAHKSE